jgi:hypothetical protein
MRLIGTITENGTAVRTKDGKEFVLPLRGTDREGFPEVLIGALRVGGDDMFRRQSIKQWIGYEVQFLTVNNETGFNFEIVGPVEPELEEVE